jgi:hypothetical protein
MQQTLATAAPDVLPTSSSETGEQSLPAANYKSPVGFGFDQGKARIVALAKEYAAGHNCSFEAALKIVSKE